MAGVLGGSPHSQALKAKVVGTDSFTVYAKALTVNLEFVDRWCKSGNIADNKVVHKIECMSVR